MPDLDAALDWLRTFVVNDSDLDGLLGRVTALAVGLVPGCDSAGITLLVDGRLQSMAVTDERTIVVDKAQYEANAGPCLDAYHERRVVRMSRQTARSRYPDFTAAASAAGVGSFMAAPLVVREDAVGALNLFAAEEHGFADVEDDVVLALASQAAVAVTNQRLYEDSQKLAAGLEAAMASRATIEQAKGVLAATYGVDPDAAFDLLRRNSQNSNVKLRTLAAQVVAVASSGQPVRLNDTLG